jgi:hypothetical protein
MFNNISTDDAFDEKRSQINDQLYLKIQIYIRKTGTFQYVNEDDLFPPFDIIIILTQNIRAKNI